MSVSDVLCVLYVWNLRDPVIEVGHSILSAKEGKEVKFSTIAQIKEAMRLEKDNKIRFRPDIPQDVLELVQSDVVTNSVIPEYEGSRLVRVVTKRGPVVVKTSVLSYNDANQVTTITDFLNGETIVYKLNYVDGKFKSVERVVEG